MLNLIQPGTVFDGVTILDAAGVSPHKKRLYNCRCSCGTEFVAVGSGVLSGNTTSCGCKRKKSLLRRNTTHGHTCRGREHKLYATWKNMRRRCADPNDTKYRFYGGIGITVCDEWNASFAAFLRDVGEPLMSGGEIDRVDPTRGYEPGNVRWVSGDLQYTNMTSNVRVDWFGRSIPLAVAAREAGVVSPAQARHRIKRLGWVVSDAVFTPTSNRRSFYP